MSRALRALHSLGAAGITPAVLDQLQRKHPPPDMHVPAVIPGLQTSRISVDLTDTFRQLRRRAGCGPSGHRNEYLRALVGSFGDSVADNVMTAYNGFAMAFVNAELPDWFYQAAAVARLIPLVKSQNTPPRDAGPRGGGPDVRPIAVGEVEVRAVTRHVTDAVLERAGGVLSPQQLAVGVKGGTSILVHGVRMLLEHNPSFVVVRMDLSNAYNAISRVVVLRRLAERPEFTHLVPLLLQVLWGAGTAYLLCTWASHSAVGIHPELQGLDAELAPFGGAARAIMDDIYAVGPPSVVFPAVQRFRLTLRLLTGLVSNIAKFVCFSHTHDLEGCPWRADAQVPLGGDRLGGSRGVMVAGVPVGDDVFVRSRMSDIASGVVTYIRDTSAKLRDHPQALWTALYYGCQSRFDYWLRHVAPRFVIEGARRVDAAILEVCEQLTYGGCFREPLTLCRMRLPGRMGGCGLRARADLAYAAYAACVAETVPRLVGPLRANVTGQSTVGFFPSMARFFANAHGSIGLRGFVACFSHTAAYFRAAWEHLQSLVQGSGVDGPLSRPPQEVEESGSMGSLCRLADCCSMSKQFTVGQRTTRQRRLGVNGVARCVIEPLRSFTQVRGLVFGHYGEASTDVHDLVTLAASNLAGMRWQLAGARSVAEMRAFLVSRCRRKVGLATGQAMARHRLARLPYIGVPRAVVQAQLQRGPRMRGEPTPYAPAPSHADFYSYQAWGSEAAVGA
ncbi:hypothetical protein AB1Y20_009113 [Prymnesium parvum]|uniref:RNA-directed DNA polymerase n=1 Tax=Prymnesium parvum TaxID=97485 RepID=A0AB34K395_PRYPA